MSVLAIPEPRLENDHDHAAVLDSQQGSSKQPKLSVWQSKVTHSQIFTTSPMVTSRLWMLAKSVVAVTVPLVLFFTITVNVYYFLAFNNKVNVTFKDIYASEKEWLFPPGTSGVLDENFVYEFLSSNDPQASLNLTNAFQATPGAASFQPDAPCIALLSNDFGSMYALCTNLNQQRLPAWASGFEALTIQSAYLSSVQDFDDHVVKNYLAVYQAFPNERSGWFQQDNIQRLACTTPEVAKPINGLQSRLIYTYELGVLTQVDCTKAEYSATKECIAVAHNARITMFDDQSGSPPYIDTYRVFQASSGTLFILHPYPSRDSIGRYTIQAVEWPVDNCLYMRDGNLGWFGVGYTEYTVQIPTIALIAKIELIGAISLILLVHYSLNPRYAHHALYHVSRLGVFGVLVLQIVISAYDEQDIMRTIFSWSRDSGEVWLLYVYVLCSVSMSVSLVALLLVRIVLEASLCIPGCILSIYIGFAAAITEEMIARLYYNEYNSENGLLPGPSASCAHEFTGCSTNKFNMLYLIFVWVAPPMVFELVRVNRLRARRLRGVQSSESVEHLTTFERKCLDDTNVEHIVHDVPALKAADSKHRVISDDVICACGFTTIHNRFLIRTKDLWILLLTQATPVRLARDISTIVWPLKFNEDGYFEVSDSKRVYISGIRRVHIHRNQQASLIHGTHHSLV